jgi:hypothetical protein
MGVSPLVLFFIDSHRDTPALPFTHPFLRHPLPSKIDFLLLPGAEFHKIDSHLAKRLP